MQDMMLLQRTLSSHGVKKGGGTEALLAGMMEGAQKFGFQIGGFDAYVSTNVIVYAKHFCRLFHFIGNT